MGVHVCVCAMRTAGITYWTFGGRLTRRMKEPWATARPTRSTTKVRSLPILLTPSKYVFFLENLFFFRSFVELVFLETYFLSIGVLFVQAQTIEVRWLCLVCVGVEGRGWVSRSHSGGGGRRGGDARARGGEGNA